MTVVFLSNQFNVENWNLHTGQFNRQHPPKIQSNWNLHTGQFNRQHPPKIQSNWNLHTGQFYRQHPPKIQSIWNLHTGQFYRQHPPKIQSNWNLHTAQFNRQHPPKIQSNWNVQKVFKQFIQLPHSEAVFVLVFLYEFVFISHYHKKCHKATIYIANWVNEVTMWKHH